MTQRYRLGSVSEIPVGQGRVFELAGKRVAVFHTRDGAVFATQADCPHRRGPLADGLLAETRVVCPLHELEFDLRTGKSLDGTCALTIYPVEKSREGDLSLVVE